MSPPLTGEALVAFTDQRLYCSGPNSQPLPHWKRFPGCVTCKVWRKYYDNEFDRWHVYGSSAAGSAISDAERRFCVENGLPLPPPRLTGIKVPVRRKGTDSTSTVADYTHLVHVGEFFRDHSTGMLPGSIASRRSGRAPGPLSQFAFTETRPPGLGWGADHVVGQQRVSTSHPSLIVTPILDLTNSSELQAAGEKARAARLAHAEEQQSKAFDCEWKILEKRMAQGWTVNSAETEIWDACAEAAASQRELTREAKVAMLKRRDEQQLARGWGACCTPRDRRICDMHGNEICR